jgi:hypothetical protein
MMPSSFGAKVLMQIPDGRRADIMNRTVNLKSVSPKAAQIIEKQVLSLLAEIDAEKNSVGSTKVAELMNEMDKPQVDTLLTSLESISRESVNKVRPKIFLFEDLMVMPQRSRVMLLNDISADILTMALRGSSSEMREAVLASISPRQRRMIESDLQSGTTASTRARSPLLGAPSPRKRFASRIPGRSSSRKAKETAQRPLKPLLLCKDPFRSIAAIDRGNHRDYSPGRPRTGAAFSFDGEPRPWLTTTRTAKQKPPPRKSKPTRPRRAIPRFRASYRSFATVLATLYLPDLLLPRASAASVRRLRISSSSRTSGRSIPARMPVAVRPSRLGMRRTAGAGDDPVHVVRGSCFNFPEPADAGAGAHTTAILADIPCQGLVASFQPAGPDRIRKVADQDPDRRRGDGLRVLKSEYFSAIDAMFSDPATIFTRMMSGMRKITIVVLIATAVVAIADFFWTRHHWFTELKMSRHEVKEENKQSQGDPFVKAASAR